MREFMLVVLLAVLLGLGLSLFHREDPGSGESLSAAGLISGDAQGFDRVTGPEPVLLPADHAAHPEYQHEWWYFTGNLEADSGRQFGFQYTLFRFAVNPSEQPSGQQLARSAWHTDQVWMAHLALSDIENRAFLTRERFARGALGMAGATESEWWLGPWQVTGAGSGWILEADGGDFALDLHINPLKPHVLQGQAGYSRKGPEPGNASRYLSFTRLGVRGEVRIGDERHEVSGFSWLDREWGSSALGEDLVGWDWFSLQFDDERDLMFFQLRDEEGRKSNYSSGVLVDFPGEAEPLGARDVTLRPLAWWTDDEGRRWPVRWQLEVPDRNLELEVEAAFPEQLWTGSVRYWEGAVVFSGLQDGLRVGGRGYLEMTGYR